MAIRVNKTTMKKNYQQPTMNVVEIEMTHMMAQSVTSVQGNLGESNLQYGGGNSSSARVKTNTVDWDDDWSE